MNKRLEEIKARKLEIRSLLEDETAEVNVEELKTEVEALDKEVETIEAEVTAESEKEEKEKEEKRKMLENLNEKEVRKVDESNKEERKMEKFTLESPEYRSAWGKMLMGKELNETEKRAVGDATFTTADTFVGADATHVGINNGGLLIPTDVRTDILTIIENTSPFYNQVRKLAVKGNVKLPYMSASDDAEWYVEATSTKREGVELKEVSLTSHSLAKNVVVTWKLEEMAVSDFISFITKEIAVKIGKALVKGIIYGTGSNQPKGAIHGLTAVTGDDAMETIIKSYDALENDFRIGAKAFISTDVNLEIIGYKDLNDNYPFLNGVSATKLVNIEVDPFLVAGDIIVGNPENYILNTIKPVEVLRESTVVGRTTTYASYGEFDGAPVAGAFVKGSFVPAE